MRLGTREYPTTYATAKGYTTLDNIPIKTSGYSHAEGQMSYASSNCSYAEGCQTKPSSLQNSVDEMQEAMKKIQRAASAAGVSMAEAIAALKNIYQSTQGNAECINTINTINQKTQEPLVKMAQG